MIAACLLAAAFILLFIGAAGFECAGEYLHNGRGCTPKDAPTARVFGSVCLEIGALLFYVAGGAA